MEPIFINEYKLLRTKLGQQTMKKFYPKMFAKTNSLNSGKILEYEKFIRDLKIKVWDRASVTQSDIGD